MAFNGDLALQAELRVLTRIAGEIARHCDRAEHNEQVDRNVLLRAGEELRAMAWRLAAYYQVQLQQCYADRLDMIESRHPLSGGGSFDGGEAVRISRTLLELQRAQMRHDVTCHPDVAGMPKYAQLRHFLLHLTKLTEVLLDAMEGRGRDVFVSERIADIFIFGIKLSTVANERLGDDIIIGG